MENNKIYFAALDENANVRIPCRRPEDAGYDVYANFEGDFLRIPAHETVPVPTKLASAFSPDFYIQIEERGSVGAKGIKKSAGVIDSGYRGEWFIATTNTTNNDLYIAKAHVVDKLNAAAEVLDVKITILPYEKAIAQAVLHRVYNEVETEVINADELQQFSSERGSGKQGSSGK